METPETTPAIAAGTTVLEGELAHLKAARPDLYAAVRADLQEQLRIAVAERAATEELLGEVREELDAVRNVPGDVLALIRKVEPRAALVLRLTCPNASALLVKLVELVKE